MEPGGAVASSSQPPAEADQQMDDYTPEILPGGDVGELPQVPEDAVERNSNPPGSVMSQPENEEIPETPQVGPTAPPGLTPLQQALHQSLDQVDGHPRQLSRPPGLSVRERSRSPVREGRNIPVPHPADEGLLAQERQWHFHCHLAKRYAKKKKQGKGREIVFAKADDKTKAGLLITRKKEWNNWKQFGAVDIIPPEEVQSFLDANPGIEILPMRWLDIDKAEIGEEEALKSRIVVRGDLESNNSLRTDSPTASQLFLNLIIAYAASLGLQLRAGGISAAFLQGTAIQRLLAMWPPKDGIPDDAVKPGSLLVAKKSVYGTRDAPRGFWKGLHDTLIAVGLKAVPNETSAYYLPGPEGEITGLLGCHVDDLLWAGGDEMQKTMAKVQEPYKFGLVEDAELKYCGRIITQTADGIKVTCPSVLDRTKAIYVAPGRRKLLSEAATPTEISQLRSVVGSLSWLARVCRPDISFGVNQLQSVQQKAQIRHLLEANKILNYAMKDRQKGIFYKKGAMDIQKCILLSITDASHAASFEEVGNGQVAGHRSQSGRILALANPRFVQEGVGAVYVLEWRSNTIKRVCRSTLQAETLSLQLGAEESEHVRQTLFVVKNLAEGLKKSDVVMKGMDHMKCLWCTDCRSLSDHLRNPSMAEVSDKRLAIDLTALRQDVWRKPNELVGNPTYADSLPEDGTTEVAWVSTETMVADGLTKAMKCRQLETLMSLGKLEVMFQFSKHDPPPEENTGVWECMFVHVNHGCLFPSSMSACSTGEWISGPIGSSHAQL